MIKRPIKNINALVGIGIIAACGALIAYLTVGTLAPKVEVGKSPEERALEELVRTTREARSKKINLTVLLESDWQLMEVKLRKPEGTAPTGRVNPFSPVR